MAISYNEDAIKLIIGIAEKLITLNKLEETFDFLNKNIGPISNDLSKSILLNNALFNSLMNRATNRLISPENVITEEATIRHNLLSIIGKVPKEIEIQRMLGKFKTSIYKTTSDLNLEKILGTVNHLVKINWLEKGINVAKSVCQVVRADGERGTGFILKNGYLMTNFHVLPNKSKIASAKIILDYEEDIFGNMRKTSEFFLESDNFAFSPLSEFDYAYIKIKDNPSNPISQWGYLELDTFSEPMMDNPVNIIQHPSGHAKQIALTANKIIGINKHKLLYETDTERGSSGSPVLNNDWKVIALHHAGLTEEDGGLVINPITGERRGANEGILIKYIIKHSNSTNLPILVT